MKRIKMLLTVIAVTTLLSGCSFGTIEEQKTGDVTYEIVKKEEIPEKRKCGSVMQIQERKKHTCM